MKGLKICLLVTLLMSFLTPKLSSQEFLEVNGEWKLCFTKQEWEALEKKVQEIVEETAQEAVKEAVVPLLAKIEGLQTQTNLLEKEAKNKDVQIGLYKVLSIAELFVIIGVTVWGITK